MPYTKGWTRSKTCCPKCGNDSIEYAIWEPLDEAHEDYHYRCVACRADWWEEGIDS